MTQYVYDNGMVAHVWANQSQDSARSHNGNFYFEGRAIYSYGSHYVAGYIAPGPLYLVNSDHSSCTTNGKHKPAIWRALDYGRGKYGNHARVPNLGDVAHVFDRLEKEYIDQRGALEKVQSLFCHDVDSCPSEIDGTRVFMSLGLPEARAVAKARACRAKVLRDAEKAKAATAKRELDQNARLAKQLANDTPAGAARSIRDILAKAATATKWQQERLEKEAQEESREYYRAAKAAKAKGWTRIASQYRALHVASLFELKKYHGAQSRYAERASIRAAIEGIRATPESLRFASVAPYAGYENPEARAMSKANRLESLYRACTEVLTSRYGKAALTPARRDDLATRATLARGMSGVLQSKAASLRLERQKATRAAWLAGETNDSGYGERLSDSEGGALLRAEKVERDESGAIVGGLLRTSWGAHVPLPEAIRAFRFLKLCRASGKAWKANGQRIQVGHFQVDSIDPSGNFRAACHRINWQEVERLARLLGVLEIAPDQSAIVAKEGAGA